MSRPCYTWPEDTLCPAPAIPGQDGCGCPTPLHAELLHAEQPDEGADPVGELLVAAQVARHTGEVQVLNLGYGPEKQ